MIQATRQWFRRNRTYLAVGAGIVGVGYLAGQYVLNKLNEARQRMSDERIAKENLRRRFEQNQEDCTYTVLALLPTATENILSELPVEQITQELQQRKSEKLSRSAPASEISPSDVQSTGDDDNKSLGSSGFVHASQVVHSEDTTAPRSSKSKLQLWDDLKINSIARAVALLYTLSMLTIFTRIQLNLLGRRNYLSSVVSLASPSEENQKIRLENHDDDNLDQDYGNDFETNRKYLTFSWWLLHRGCNMILREVETAVKNVFGPLTPRDNVSFERFSSLVLEVRRQVEGATETERRAHKWLDYLLPPRAEVESVLRESGIGLPSDSGSDDSPAISPSLRRLLDETSDLVDSPIFTHVMTLSLDATFSHFVDDKIATLAFKIPTQTESNTSGIPADFSQGSRIQEVGEDADESMLDPKQQTTKLATILAIVTRQAHTIGSGGNITAIPNPAPSEQGGGQSSAGKDSNEYLAAIESVRDLEAFAAVVYSSNFEFEGADLTDPAQQETVQVEEAVQTLADAKAEVETTLESAWSKATST